MAISLSDHFTFQKLIKFTYPSIIMMVFTSVYGVVDGLFVSNFAGSTPFAALNLIMPALMIFGAIGFMFGTGGSALVAKTLGEGRKEDANRYFSMVIETVVILGILLSAIGFLLMPQFAKWFGASEEMLPYCVSYGRTAIVFNTAFMLQNNFQGFLITAERPKLGLYFIVAAGCTNMVLDALFVGVFRWGVTGAAFATGLSECVGGIFPLLYFMSKKNTSLLRFRPTKPEWRPLLKAAWNGSSELMSNISSSIVGMVYNLQLMKYFGENGVSAYGTIMYVQFVFFAIIIGYSISAAPIMSYHYGAQNHGEMKNVLQKSLMIVNGSSFILALAAQLLAGPIAKLFVGYNAELYNLTTHAFHIFAIAYLFVGFNIYASSFFTALNNGTISAIIAFTRTLVFQVGCVLFLPRIIGGDGIWSAIIVAESMAFLLGLTFLVTLRKKYHYWDRLPAKIVNVTELN